MDHPAHQLEAALHGLNSRPTRSATDAPGLGASAGPRCLLDSLELATVQDSLGLIRELMTTSRPSLSQLQLESLFRLELRLLFLWSSLSLDPLPASESLRLGWLRTRASSLFRDPRLNPRPFHGLLLPPV